MEITPEYLIIKLYSVSKLEMVSKSLAGFSRELLRVDEQRKARNEQSLLIMLNIIMDYFAVRLFEEKKRLQKQLPNSLIQQH